LVRAVESLQIQLNTNPGHVEQGHLTVSKEKEMLKAFSGSVPYLPQNLPQRKSGHFESIRKLLVWKCLYGGGRGIRTPDKWIMILNCHKCEIIENVSKLLVFRRLCKSN
jgi:hypothetical protein